MLKVQSVWLNSVNIHQQKKTIVSVLYPHLLPTSITSLTLGRYGGLFSDWTPTKTQRYANYNNKKQTKAANSLVCNAGLRDFYWISHGNNKMFGFIIIKQNLIIRMGDLIFFSWVLMLNLETAINKKSHMLALTISSCPSQQTKRGSLQHTCSTFPLFSSLSDVGLVLFTLL